MSNIIFIFADPESHIIELYFPIPRNGVMKIIKSTSVGEPAIIPFKNANEEQKAFYWFWDNGTIDRLNALISNGRGGGVRQNLRWLIKMRIIEAFEKSGFKYDLKIISNTEKWNEICKHTLNKTHQLMAKT